MQEAGELTDRMRALVEDVLHYSRVVNTNTLVKEMVDLKQTADEVISDLSGPIEEANAKPPAAILD